MLIFAIDPGHKQSAWVIWDGHAGKVLDYKIEENNGVFAAIDMFCDRPTNSGIIVIEEIACYGMAVGAEVFVTCRWSGQFEREAKLKGFQVDYLKRRECKIHLCNSVKAKDSNIRQALIDRFGPQGTMKKPGPLYGITKDKLAALAVAVTFSDKYVTAF
jgi:hypothetical protein